MAELPDLAPIPEDNVSNDDILLIYDMQNNRAYKVTRRTLLGNVARQNADVEFGALAAEEATFTQVTAALLSFASGGGVADMVTASGSVGVPTIASQASEAVNMAVEGAVMGMAATVTFSDALSPGLTYHAHVSAEDMVTITFTNASDSSIPAASKQARVMLFALPE